MWHERKKEIQNKRKKRNAERTYQQSLVWQSLANRNYAKHRFQISMIFYLYTALTDHLCGLVVRVPARDPEVPGSIPDATRFSEK
jgi:hypothetical protein